MSYRFLVSCILLGGSLSLASCGDDGRNGGRGGNSPDSGGMMSCMADDDCNDMIDCTSDSCAIGGVCRYSEINERCDDGQVCLAGQGCVAPPECASDADCDDMIDCTEDSCGVDEMCTHTPINERCPMGQLCNPASGCFESTPCATDDECDDGDFCNGREWCMPEFGCQPAREPRSCDDSDMCTMDRCDTALNMCVNECDATNPMCECPVETPCAGTFTLSPIPTQSCAFGMVNYRVASVTFSCPAGILSVRAGVPSAGMDTPLTQAPRPTDGSFDVVARIDGGCVETFRMQGMFTGPDAFTATFTAMYTDMDGISCALGGCSPLTFSVTGTRM